MYRRIAITLTLFFLGASALAYFTETTYDDGDSIMHYLIARHSITHPSLLMHHWGKPLFTLLASPFAAGGFIGMKMFNCLVAAATALFTCLSAKKSGFKIPVLAIAFLYSAPAFLLSQYSGLTEPLFALLMICGYYFVITGKPWAAAICISFLPFVRSEGLVIGIIYAIYWALNRKWKPIPLLLTGNVVYAIAGGLVSGDLLWTFHDIPYHGGAGKYGTGNDWFHFIRQLYFQVGMPLFALFVIGGICYIFDWIRIIRNKQKDWMFRAQVFILCGCSLGFIVTHTIFWEFGLFESVGISRVLICIFPYIILIGIYGLDMLTEKVPEKFSYVIIGLIAAIVVIFPYTPNKAGLQAEKNFSLHPRQTAIRQASDWMKREFRLRLPVYAAAPFWYEELNLDPFDSSVCLDAKTLNEREIPRGRLILWDNYFMESEEGLKPEFFKDSSRFELLFISNFEHEDHPEKGEARVYLSK